MGYNIYDENYEDLANAIIKQAAMDYQKALINAKKWNDEVGKLERYFNGDDIKVLTKVDGPKLADMLKQEVIDCHYSMAAIRKSREKKNN